MEERTLEVSVVSADELQVAKKFGTPKFYVAAYIYANRKKVTKVDKTGGLSPRWNTKLVLTCDEQLLRQPGYDLNIELYSHGILRNKKVGTVTIPLVEIGRDEKFSDKPQVMAFQVRSPRSGQLKGLLNLSVRLGEKRVVQYPQRQPQAAYPPGYGGGGYGAQYGAPQYGYGAPQHGYGGQGYSPYGAGNQRRPRKNPGFGAGLLGGALGGLLVGDMIDDMGDHSGGGYGDDYGDYGGGDGGDFGGDF